MFSSWDHFILRRTSDTCYLLLLKLVMQSYFWSVHFMFIHCCKLTHLLRHRYGLLHCARTWKHSLCLTLALEPAKASRATIEATTAEGAGGQCGACAQLLWQS